MLPNPGMTFTPFDPLPASDLNDMVENIEALYDGSAFDSQGIPGYKVKINPPQGFMTNGRISRTVSSNNLTVALKTLANADPSASDPVYIRVGDTMRAVTAALGVTKNAGTNWMDLGSASHATQDVDVFVYIGYNATDGVTIGFSRIPYARIYSDFNTTNTNDRYAAISTITNASANDNYEVIGRVNVTLSASASYNWSVPGTSIIINKPITDTRWMTYSQQFTNLTVGNGVSTSRYKLSYNQCIAEPFFQLGSTSSVGTAPTLTVPISGNSKYSSVLHQIAADLGFLVDEGSVIYTGNLNWNGGNTAPIISVLNASSSYLLTSTVTASVPHVWANTDKISFKMNYLL